ncbi:MAG: GNAT family N-acetyltransferase [Cyanobacteria bacterium QH_8_48_120]|jgi:amino-acid N-acetyltransferase|nr:MAG: GNAT family N-acetyltransferase [Cyanobacteria bacterium QH_1_48_107]PSO59323.1 MAG: GNAT family N-acetyltransferase [Cyanobacteria bacterium QH_2_48_84]PSO60031.1 MAG: GNAT family N-acetyltransferase [Cyanobacteria bacterium QH_10_48_56]PSO67992.1 MAG: GNAT family N-acetyltransferase [Cyanobacteria bacterium QH_7_48_89]PSO72340.1 MAG: GNAT family N-acetyltransferase [Cyanobacteria bacterium QH_3_48_40]PSO73773.1 MAG: GNAT family N-acetyltransferase [Cyanobacteria bacterium QS_1_48_34]
MTNASPALPTGCVLRPATSRDIWAIRKLVLLAKLDPTQLRWSQFSVIEFEGQVVACGQLRSFQTAQELGSMVVAPAWRGRGLGTYIAKHLIEVATQPLYLECLGSNLAAFYARFGFVPVSWRELPLPLKRKFSLSALAATLVRLPVTLMQYRQSRE